MKLVSTLSRFSCSVLIAFPCLSTACVRSTTAQHGQITPAESENRKVQRIVVLVASWCPHCSNVERFLKQHKIDYVAYDIDSSSLGKKLYQENGANGLPIILIGSKTIRGFKPDEILEAIP